MITSKLALAVLTVFMLIAVMLTLPLLAALLSKSGDVIVHVEAVMS